ncbi:long-chain-acyl-CoA synthetase [Alloalcanivorax profundimaris]|uniref:long-chain-acyl-CoA synthetase n=1 Tax=Alloalcanivorax profundimaris TaxID=2735259 RepID=UPI00188792B5|nr:long-chain-acyl-CoA synthetase [Alloalcanivorax profundimaris]MBF1800178.1 long-chain-acyl-CoA synthetase [Alloalcanivorax profundimaris]
MRHGDVITLPKLLTKVPEVVGNLPALIKGARLGKLTDTRRPVGLGVAIERVAAEHPAGIALIQDERAFTYATLNGWANRIADYLAAIGLQKGDTVAVNLENRPELLATVIGCAKLGVCAALLNTSQRGKVLVHSFNLVAPKAAIIGAEQVAAIREVRDRLDLKEHFLYFADHDTLADPGEAPEGYVNLAEAIRHRASDNPASSQRTFLRDPLFYIYTSGTTGLPKAVVFNHGRWEKAYGGFGFSSVRLDAHDRLYCTLPFYHATGLVVCWASVIAGRGGLVLARRFSASRFWQDVRRHDCTAFGYVGELCRYLHEQPEKPDDADNPVRTIVGNGLRPGIWKAFKKRFDIDRVAEFYTASESNVAFTNVFNFDNTVGFSPVGYAIVKYDKEADQPVRDKNGHMIRVNKGEAGLMLGEITEKTPFDGYTDPEKTEKSIFRDAFKKGDAWFNTGDMMRDIGFRHAQFVDRLGDTFRWKGENVSTTEVEQILDGFEQIVESVVYGVEIPATDGRAGMAELRLDRPHGEADWAGLSAYLGRELPPYAIPVFLRVTDGGVETTGTFKHQKNTLKEEKYDLERVDDPVYVLLPGEHRYQPLTPEIQQAIDGGEYRL